MKTVIAGSRDITDYNLVKTAIEDSGFVISEVVCGKSRGVDSLGELWAKNNNIPVKEFPAKWNDIKEGGPVKLNKFGKPYNPAAGFDRNEEMAKWAEALISVHNGSNGSAHMLKMAKKYGLKVYEVKV